MGPKLNFYLFPPYSTDPEKRPYPNILFQFSVKNFLLNFIANLENCPMWTVLSLEIFLVTILPAKSDSDLMFC